MKRAAAIADRLHFPHFIEHHTIEFHLDEGQIAALLSALAEAGVMYTNIDVLRPTLSDYFLHMVKREVSYETLELGTHLRGFHALLLLVC